MAEKGSNDGPLSGNQIKFVSPSFITGETDGSVNVRVPPVLFICKLEFLGIAGSTGTAFTHKLCG